jgi:arginase family enzyme
MGELDKYGVRDLNAPWYAGSPSFARAPWVEPNKVPPGEIAVVGMPIDEYATSSQRTGMRWGPRRIREASLRQARYYAATADQGLLDIRSGRVTAWPDHLPMVDTGDAAIIHHDAERQVAAGRDHVRRASLNSSVTVTLGGDHMVAYPAAEGVVQAWRERKPNLKVGYLHFDSHSDFNNERLGQGRINHGTCARRVSEIPEIKRMAWYGLNGASEPEQYRLMRERGFKAFTSWHAHRVGADKSMNQALEYVMDGVDILYVSIDIDVTNNAHAPATGSAVFEGLSGDEFLESIRQLARLDELVGVDLCEVDPEVDGTWRTELLAASALLSILSPRIYRQVDVIAEDALRAVFEV